MTPRPQQYHVVLIPVEQGWVAYQILRWADGALVAGGECPTRRHAAAEARERIRENHLQEAA